MAYLHFNTYQTATYSLSQIVYDLNLFLLVDSMKYIFPAKYVQLDWFKTF